ncbi:Pr6Pr family membrane protein [Agrococcus versicolor]|uniref:Pr6Pr family membrane protein n=1 Tax=Agrococcus versicolor TaxID=501482 RepID=A0ABN3APR5_9MICO
MSSRTAAIVLRLAGATLALFAMGYQLLAVHIPAGYSVLNFFSYFTNLSNIMIAIVFVVSAVRLIDGRTDPSATDVALRGGVVVYILFVGLVFNTLLRDVDLGDLLPWVNGILHFLLPVLGLVDWILWPPRRRLPLSVVGWWMIWPAVYAIAAVVRGAITGFYPYPFFDPAASGGYGGVALLCVGMVVGFLILALGIRAIGNWLSERRWQDEAETDPPVASTA